jgi:hypothetical protein
MVKIILDSPSDTYVWFMEEDKVDQIVEFIHSLQE